MEKKERRRVLIHRQKSYLTAGVVTLVAVVAMMGAYQYEKRAEKQEQQEQVTLAEQTDTAETQNTTCLLYTSSCFMRCRLKMTARFPGN